jgi:hypothetical protein
MMYMGADDIAKHAAGDDRVDPVTTGGDFEAPTAAGKDMIPSGARDPATAYGPLSMRYTSAVAHLHDNFERVKQGAGLPSNASTRVDLTGNVFVTDTGEWIGNVLDG